MEFISTLEEGNPVLDFGPSAKGKNPKKPKLSKGTASALLLPELPEGTRRIIGLDLSLNAGWAEYDIPGDTLKYGVWSPSQGDQLDRMISIHDSVRELCQQPGRTVVMIEDFAHGLGNRAHTMGGIGYLVRYGLRTQKVPFYLASPGQIKKFTTGKGSAKKSEMILGVYKRFQVDLEGEPGSEDKADAISICFLCRALFGLFQPTLQPQQEVLKELVKKYF